MAYIGKQPTAVPLTSSDITDGIVTTAKIADDAVDNTKLDLTDDFAFTGTISGAGGLVKLHSTTLSSAASSVSIDGHFTSAYDVYQLHVYNYENATDNQAAFWRANVGGTAQASAIYLSSGNGMTTTDADASANSAIGVYDAYNQQYFTWQQTQNTGTDLSKTNSIITIFNPLDTTHNKTIHYNVSYEPNQTYINAYEHFAVKVRTNSALSGLTFLAASGNISTGTFTLYGVAK